MRRPTSREEATNVRDIGKRKPRGDDNFRVDTKENTGRRNIARVSDENARNKLCT